MSYYFKKTIWAIMYLVLTVAFGFGIMFVGTNHDIPKLIASLLNLGLFTVAMVLVFYKEGKRAYHTLLENDLTRKRIIETGKDLPIKRAEEYKAYKGFMIGVFVCLPLILLLIAHLIVSLATDGQVTTLGIISGFAYLIFYEPFAIFFHGEVYWHSFMITLYAVPYVSLAIGLPYYFGARAKRLEREEIEKTNKQIYGKESK